MMKKYTKQVKFDQTPIFTLPEEGIKPIDLTLCNINAIKQIKLFFICITIAHKHVRCTQNVVLEECEELMADRWIIESIVHDMK